MWSTCHVCRAASQDYIFSQHALRPPGNMSLGQLILAVYICYPSSGRVADQLSRREQTTTSWLSISAWHKNTRFALFTQRPVCMSSNVSDAEHAMKLPFNSSSRRRLVQLYHLHALSLTRNQTETGCAMLLASFFLSATTRVLSVPPFLPSLPLFLSRPAPLSNKCCLWVPPFPLVPASRSYRKSCEQLPADKTV